MKVKLKESKTVKKLYNRQLFEINQYIPIDVKQQILALAYESYLNNLEQYEGLTEAITGMDADIQMAVVGAAVVNELEFDEGMMYDDLLKSGFIDFVLKNVVNYQDIRDSAHDLVRLFVICDRIPDINDLAGDAFYNNPDKMSKEKIEEMTELIKTLGDQR